ncbi:MAG: M15 family metallopeptidase [Pseudomonadota bacterium]
MENRLIPAIIAVIVAIMIGIGVLLYVLLTAEDDPFAADFGENTADFDDSPLFDEMEGPAVDSGARIEIEKLRRQIEALTQQIEQLDNKISAVEAAQQDAAAAAVPRSPDDQFSAIQNTGPNEILDAYAQVVLIANRREVNGDLRIASPTYLVSVFGPPRENLTDDCQPLTNPRLKDKLRLEEVGPIRVQMLEPAVESLRRVFERIELADPDLYARINTAGALCVRRIRGSTRVSTHAFGLSLDLNIDGRLDQLGDGRTQLGLTILADFFRDEGWFWGASFGREDSMHFEVSRDLVEQWIEEGKL